MDKGRKDEEARTEFCLRETDRRHKLYKAYKLKQTLHSHRKSGRHSSIFPRPVSRSNFFLTANAI